MEDTTCPELPDPEIDATAPAVPPAVITTEPHDKQKDATEEQETLQVSPGCKLERRIILFLFAFGCTSLVAGVVYGFPALRRQLQEDGTTLTEAELGAVYTAGAWSAQGGRFFTGLARDRFGTRSVACVSLFFTLAGSLGIALSDPSNGIALGSALFCISLGAGVQLVMQPVGSLFPQYSNAVVSSLSGSFQISGLVFLALTSPSWSRRVAFLVYAAIVALLIVLAWILLPSTASYLEQNEEESKQETETATEQPSEREQPDKEEKQDEDYPKLTRLQQIVSSEFIGLTVWFSVCLIPLQYYVGSIGFQLEEKGDDDGFYSDLYSIVFAAAAVFAPCGGYLADRLGLGLVQGLSTLLVALSFFILGSSKIPLKGQSAGLVCYSVGRMMIFGMFFSNVGRRFGYENFGTLSGIGLMASALISLLQYPLIAAASEGPSKAMVVNFSSGAALLALIPYCIWLAFTERRVDLARSLLKA